MADQADDQPLILNYQYVKDLSFENPNSPAVFGTLTKSKLNLDVNLDVTPAHIRGRTYEIVLTMRVHATCDDKAAFLIELDYAAVATIAEGVAAADAERLLLAETPRHLFPFARSVLATVTRDGGFPPLVVNPIDFEQFYQRNKQNTLAAEAKAGPDAPAEPDAEAEAAPNA